MKLLAFTDVHLNKNAFDRIREKAIKEKPDLLICCGDISVFGFELDKTSKFINNIGIKTLIIPGNHESPDEIKYICNKNKNLINLHRNTFEFGDYLFFGWGTGGFSFIEKEFDDIFRKFKNFLYNKKKLIFITHAPIYGTKVDYLPFFGHRGCKSTRKFVEEIQPILTFCGHFHENFKKQDKIKKSLIINPGKDGMIVELE
ncbi:metallophosphoesterase family protein [Candidatus Woesearchaeota archaeon]|nr:metallophosphoesterase family protein [Candidatus Woesearchaeota archaeon]